MPAHSESMNRSSVHQSKNNLKTKEMCYAESDDEDRHVKNSTMLNVINGTKEHSDCHVYHDLPLSKSIFMGRESETSKVIKLIIDGTHLINICGSPGFGKSSLAINVGYKMIEHRSSVRYINVAEAFSDIESFSGTYGKSSDFIQLIPLPQPQSLETELSNKAGDVPALVLSEHVVTNFDFSTHVTKEDILNWSNNITCQTILVLDNCDVQLYSDRKLSDFVNFMREVVRRSQNKVHIIFTSQKQLTINDDFEKVVVKELNQTLSQKLLRELAPNIKDSDSAKIANFTEGCPLALKVIGKLLNQYEDELVPWLEEQLEINTMKLLDQPSLPEERFREIMTVAFNQLQPSEQEFGFYISLFTGSFNYETAKNIIPLNDTPDLLRKYTQHSLLDEYTLERKTRYKMHRLIRVYFGDIDAGKVKVKKFDTQFCHYFNKYIVNYAVEIKYNNLTESREHDFNCEQHNIYHFLDILLSDMDICYGPLEAQALVFAVVAGLVPTSKVQRNYDVLIKHTASVRDVVNENSFSDFYSGVVHHFHEKCTCQTMSDSLKQLFYVELPCERIFTCEIIPVLLSYGYIESRLNSSDLAFLYRIQIMYCQTWLHLIKILMSLTFIGIVYSLIKGTPRNDSIAVCRNLQHSHSVPHLFCIISCLPIIMSLCYFLLFLYTPLIGSLINNMIMVSYFTAFPLLFSSIMYFIVFIVIIIWWPPYSKQSKISLVVVSLLNFYVWFFFPTYTC